MIQPGQAQRTKHVAFFRYVNFGKTGSPRSEHLIEAFGGSAVATSHQTNGTIVFDADDPEAHTIEALSRLQQRGYEQPAIVRPLAEIVQLVAEHTTDAEEEGRVMVSFFTPVPADTLHRVPARSRNGLVEILHLTPRYAVSKCSQRGTTIGDATVFLEPELGTPVTSRTLGTLQRLVKKHSTI